MAVIVNSAVLVGRAIQFREPQQFCSFFFLLVRISHLLLDASGSRWLTTCSTDTFSAFTDCELGQLDPMSAAERVPAMTAGAADTFINIIFSVTAIFLATLFSPTSSYAAAHFYMGLFGSFGLFASFFFFFVVWCVCFFAQFRCRVFCRFQFLSAANAIFAFSHFRFALPRLFRFPVIAFRISQQNTGHPLVRRLGSTPISHLYEFV